MAAATCLSSRSWKEAFWHDLSPSYHFDPRYAVLPPGTQGPSTTNIYDESTNISHINLTVSEVSTVSLAQLLHGLWTYDASLSRCTDVSRFAVRLLLLHCRKLGQRVCAVWIFGAKPDLWVAALVSKQCLETAVSDLAILCYSYAPELKGTYPQFPSLYFLSWHFVHENTSIRWGFLTWRCLCFGACLWVLCDFWNFLSLKDMTWPFGLGLVFSMVRSISFEWSQEVQFEK